MSHVRANYLHNGNNDLVERVAAQAGPKTPWDGEIMEKRCPGKKSKKATLCSRADQRGNGGPQLHLKERERKRGEKPWHARTKNTCLCRVSFLFFSFFFKKMFLTIWHATQVSSQSQTTDIAIYGVKAQQQPHYTRYLFLRFRLILTLLPFGAVLPAVWVKPQCLLLEVSVWCSSTDLGKLL